MHTSLILYNLGYAQETYYFTAPKKSVDYFEVFYKAHYPPPLPIPALYSSTRIVVPAIRKQVFFFGEKNRAGIASGRGRCTMNLLFLKKTSDGVR